MKLSLLYSLTSHGQTQTWQIEVKDECFRTHEGILGGAITTSEWTECFGKNAGKANETSAPEQADKEAAAKHKKKLEAGYCESVEEIDKPKFFEPLLAKQWEDYKGEVEWPLYSSPKLDGLRCIITKDGMFSRNGKPIVSAPHVFEALKPILQGNRHLVFDGELYASKYKTDFNKIVSLAKKTKPTREDLEESAKNLEYWVFDVLDKRYVDTSFKERLALVTFYLSTVSSSIVKSVSNTLAKNEDELDQLYAQYLEEGFEGQMVRNPHAPYENKRSKNLLKRKTFVDGEFRLVDLEEGRGNRAGMATRAILKTAAGTEFEAGMIGSHEYCVDLLKNKEDIIGQMVTVVYQNLTPDKGVPRFGKMKAVRWDQ